MIQWALDICNMHITHNVSLNEIICMDITAVNYNIVAVMGIVICATLHLYNDYCTFKLVLRFQWKQNKRHFFCDFRCFFYTLNTMLEVARFKVSGVQNSVQWKSCGSQRENIDNSVFNWKYNNAKYDEPSFMFFIFQESNISREASTG